MPVNFQNIINYCINLNYIVPGNNGVSINKYAGTVKLPNCYLGEFDISTNSFNKKVCSINRATQKNRPIVILAESPHKDEFDYTNNAVIPKYPLIKYHNKIMKFLMNYLPKKLKGKYDVYLVNAIQYQCSFGLNLNKYRTQKNKVFALTWNLEPALIDLVLELKQLVNENKKIIILNCCTKELKKYLCMTDLLKINFPNSKISEQPHPSGWH